LSASLALLALGCEPNTWDYILGDYWFRFVVVFHSNPLSLSRFVELCVRNDELDLVVEEEEKESPLAYFPLIVSPILQPNEQQSPAHIL